MKTLFLTCLATVAAPVLALAQLIDPVADFQSALAVPSGDKVLKWECDVNGDGKNEILLALKSDFEKDMQSHEPPSWSFYIANASGTSYARSTGTENQPNTLSVDDLPLIDPEACFVGQISELGKSGIVTMRIDNPREGESVGKIYAYTIEGDHLKRSELARYVIVEGPHALFTKYLANDKRTHVQLQQLQP
jgi:hypothetical protein